MEKLDQFMIKKVLTTIESKGIIGSQLLSILKERNPDFDETTLYMTLKSLTEQGCIDNYIAPKVNNCKVKI